MAEDVGMKPKSQLLTAKGKGAEGGQIIIPATRQYNIVTNDVGEKQLNTDDIG